VHIIKTFAKPRKYVVKDVGSEILRPSFSVKAYKELKQMKYKQLKSKSYIYVIFKIN
jgi:hypothetical protein